MKWEPVTVEIRRLRAPFAKIPITMLFPADTKSGAENHTIDIIRFIVMHIFNGLFQCPVSVCMAFVSVCMALLLIPSHVSSQLSAA